ncbi:MAG TPA: SirB2 family protein [Burkholderiaceae bacterium]
MNWAALLKEVHVGCVALTGAGFLARSALALAGSPVLRTRLVQVLPHVIDTVLLASAIALAVTLRLSPLEQPWLMAKILALPLYVVCGSLALRRGKSRAVRAIAMLAAISIYTYIVSAAITHSPWPPASVSDSQFRDTIPAYPSAAG